MRGGAAQFIEETERSLHDAIMIVRRAIKNDSVVAGGGAIEVRGDVSASLVLLVCRVNARPAQTLIQVPPTILFFLVDGAEQIPAGLLSHRGGQAAAAHCRVRQGVNSAIVFPVCSFQPQAALLT